MTSPASPHTKDPSLVYAGTAMVSAAVLMQEIVLTRIFSFSIASLTAKAPYTREC